MVEGPSGLLAIAPPWCRPRYEPSRQELHWPNGAKATLFSADAPERLRGHQHDAFWADELCAWRYAMDAWDMLLLGLRLGDDPRGIAGRRIPVGVARIAHGERLDLDLSAPDHTTLYGRRHLSFDGASNIVF